MITGTPKQADLKSKHDQLLKEYNAALDKDVEFECLKIIYLDLKDVKAKLSELPEAEK